MSESSRTSPNPNWSVVTMADVVGDEHLAADGSRRDAGADDHRAAEEVVGFSDHLAAMHTHPDIQCTDVAGLAMS